MNSKLDIAAKSMDITARGIDLISVLAQVSNRAEGASLILKEVGYWLGKEGLDELELTNFLRSTRALVRPNQQREVGVFFDAVTDRKPRPSVVPLWAQPSGALGRLVAGDPFQRWLTSTICCFLRYHDERFIKLAVSSLIILASRPGKKPLTEYELAYHPEMLRLEEIVSKVIHSNWTHIANSGLIGSDTECPRLPTELKWACNRGHNIASHKLAVILSKLCNPPKETIFESELLLTNLTLWLTWHFSGRLRVVVSGSIVYDRVLGEAESTVELRVAKFCTMNENGEGCCSYEHNQTPNFQMLENVAGDLRSLFTGEYDNRQTLGSEPRVRTKLYHSPFKYPHGIQRKIGIQTLRTAQELLRWYCSLPIKKETMGSRLDFTISLASTDTSDESVERVSDLLGRTPQLLLNACGELGRSSVVFSPPEESMSSEDESASNIMDMDDDDDLLSRQDENPDFEEKPLILLRYFPILQDLLDEAKQSCKCLTCAKDSAAFYWDEHCLRFNAFMEVMLYFSHGIADAFGVPDISGRGATTSGDSGAMAILLDAIDTCRFDPSNLEGKIEWHTLLCTVCQNFLGCPPLDTLTDATYNDGPVDTPLPFIQHLGATIIAVQHGDLAVVAPWIDFAQKLDYRRCFRLEVVQGRIGIPIQESGKVHFQAVARDTAVIETQHTEDVSDYVSMFEMPLHDGGSEIQISTDKCNERHDFMLVSVAATRYKLLMRVTSESHSRMVDPSRPIIKMARGIYNRKCNHSSDKVGVVPDGHSVELYRFDEILGRWGAKIPKVDEEATPSKSTSTTRSRAKGKIPSNKTKVICVTHVLESDFKLNTALALDADNPTLLCTGNICLTCALKEMLNLSLEDWENSYQRRIINYYPSKSLIHKSRY
ncbi:hypothetical protein DER45DRAFT_551552 [Fusarium avenaceum]|nr:hypothetical protein DER45DRAFT_551552 [Fusarium avenaceum]